MIKKEILEGTEVVFIYQEVKIVIKLIESDKFEP